MCFLELYMNLLFTLLYTTECMNSREEREKEKES